MWALLIAAALGGVQAKATPHTGAPKTGELKSISDDGLVLAADDGEAKFSLSQLRAIDFPEARKGTDPHEGPVVELVDGSTLLAESYLSADGKADIRLEKKIPLASSAKQVGAVLFRTQRNFPKLQAQWRDLIDSSRQGDLLVVRRSRATEGERVVHSLDQLECIIHSINEQEVLFSLDGERRKAPRAKLEGVIFFHGQTAKLADALAEVRVAGGASYAAQKVTFQDDKLQVLTRCGLALDVPAGETLSIRFSGGDIIYLSDLKPQSVEWRPYVPTRIGGERLSKLYAPRIDQANDGGQLRLEPGGDTFEKGLALHSRTELVYRLPDAFKRFQAEVGLDPRYRNAGNVEFLIKSEKAELFRQAITPEKPRLTVEVDLTGVRRLTVIVDFGGGWDVGDFVNLCDARLTK